MKFNLTAIIDDETRKEFREQLLGMVRGLTREILNETILTEIRLKLDKAQHELAANDWNWKRNIFSVMKEVMIEQTKTEWPTIGRLIHDACVKSADVVVAQKLANKTVWEAAQQKDFIREIVRDEMKNSFKQVFGEKI